MEAQGSLLAKGTNFAIVPLYPHNQLRKHAKNLIQKQQMSSVKTSRAVKCFGPIKSNIIKEEAKVLKKPRRDRLMVILTEGKVVAIVVLDKQDYVSNMEDLLEQSYTYRTLAADPTKMQMEAWGTTYTKGCIPQEYIPKFYGLPELSKMTPS